MITERPNVIGNTVIPSTPHEMELAAKVTADAKSKHESKSWAEVLVIASAQYNMEVCRNLQSLSNPIIATKGLLGSTTPQLPSQFWVNASKYASGPLRDASVRVGLHAAAPGDGRATSRSTTGGRGGAGAAEGLLGPDGAVGVARREEGGLLGPDGARGVAVAFWCQVLESSWLGRRGREKSL